MEHEFLKALLSEDDNGSVRSGIFYPDSGKHEDYRYHDRMMEILVEYNFIPPELYYEKLVERIYIRVCKVSSKKMEQFSKQYILPDKFASLYDFLETLSESLIRDEYFKKGISSGDQRVIHEAFFPGPDQKVQSLKPVIDSLMKDFKYILSEEVSYSNLVVVLLEYAQAKGKKDIPRIETCTDNIDGWFYTNSEHLIKDSLKSNQKREDLGILDEYTVTSESGKKKIIKIPKTSTSDIEASGKTSDDPMIALQKKQRSEIVYLLLAELQKRNPVGAKILRMSDIFCMEYEEIADKFNVSVQFVKAERDKARRQFVVLGRKYFKESL